jgi:hypothetical protein
VGGWLGDSLGAGLLLGVWLSDPLLGAGLALGDWLGDSLGGGRGGGLVLGGSPLGQTLGARLALHRRFARRDTGSGSHTAG